MEETGATPEQVARAFVVCREVFDLTELRRARWRRSTTSSPPTPRRQLYLEFRRLIDRSVRWFLTSRPSRLDVAAEVARFRAVVARARPADRRRCSRASERTAARSAADRRAARSAGAPSRARDPRGRACSTSTRCSTCVEIATETGETPSDVAPVYFADLRAVRHRRDADAGDPSCRATTAGTPWPAARCATTCTPCSRA